MLDPVLLSAIGDLELVARVMVDGTVSGLHRSPFHGYSAEFSQYRHYRHGDDLKYLDWKLFARTDRLYTKQLIPSAGFDEVLLEKPVALEAEHPVGITASELALPQQVGTGGAAIATVTRNGAARAAIASWPHGSGRILFSGALDAWRYRARDEDGFARFWTSIVANLAAEAAARLSVTITPAVAAPDDLLTIRAAVRPSQFSKQGARVVVPAIEASLVGADGSRQFVRLWPVAQSGVFEGVIGAPHAGQYDVRASSGRDITADAPLIVAGGVRHPPAHDEDALRLIVRVTGGVMADASDRRPLETHLRSRQRNTVEAIRHPMRSAWWSLAFAAALCGEWALRRRGGAR